MLQCRSHPETEAVGNCSLCGTPCCGGCLTQVGWNKVCFTCRPYQPTNFVHPSSYGVPQQSYQPSQPRYPTRLETCDEAKQAMIWGIVGLFCLQLIFGIIALIRAYQAKQILRERPELAGHGMAQAGFILGIIDVSIGGVFGLIYLIATFLSMG